MAMPTGERIVTLETKMLDFEKKLDQVSTKLDTLIVMSQSQSSLEERLKKIETTTNLWRWLSPTLSAVVAAVGTYLIVFFLQNR